MKSVPLTEFELALAEALISEQKLRGALVLHGLLHYDRACEHLLLIDSSIVRLRAIGCRLDHRGIVERLRLAWRDERTIVNRRHLPFTDFVRSELSGHVMWSLEIVIG